MYGEATKFYNQAKTKCKYGTFLTRLWKGMSLESAIQLRDYHRVGRHDKEGQTCPRCANYYTFDNFYNSRSEKSGKDHVCKECRKRMAKFNWEHKGLKEKQQLRRLKLCGEN